MSKNTEDSNPPSKDPPIAQTGSVSLLLASSSNRTTKLGSQATTSKNAKQSAKQHKSGEKEAPTLTQIEKERKIIKTLEGYCRTYWTNIQNREWDLTAWTNMSPAFAADPAVGSLPQFQNLAEFVQGRRLLTEEYPSYALREVELSTELDEPNGRAECFLGLEITGAPEGVVRQGVGILEFLREDQMAIEMGKKFLPGEEVPKEEWYCFRYRNIRGLSGMIMGPAGV